MIKPEALRFPPLHCSLDSTLGDYYQDFSAAIELVESGYHGMVDEQGIPLVAFGRQGSFANPVSTAQYGLANLTQVRRGDERRAELARAQLEWLVSNQEPAGAWAGCWLMRHNNQKYPWLRAPWTGALASGNAISALLRGWEMFGEDRYRQCASLGYRALIDQESVHGLVERGDGAGSLWFEEYPGTPPLHVLNGHLYTAFAVLDHARVFGDDAAFDLWKRAVSTAADHLDDFDLGYWSAYDTRFLEPTSVHYHTNIHIPQLHILASLSGDPRFTRVVKRWEGYAGSRASKVRLAVELRLRRFRRS